MICIILYRHLLLSSFITLLYIILVASKTVPETLSPHILPNGTRRILRGNAVFDTLPYMVYLRAATNEMQQKDPNWLCGGVIIHDQYILTSAACIEDAKRFYVVSGTHRWIPNGAHDECIEKGAKRATWKIIPKNYVYDGDDLNNIRWMINDIAVIRVEDNFNFEKRVRGCDFIPQKISYNNQSEELETPGKSGIIAGWGSTDRFGDRIYLSFENISSHYGMRRQRWIHQENPTVFGRTTINSPDLLETHVTLISKKKCKKRWPERYHYIIDESMICAKDGVNSEASQICMEQDGNCKELIYSDEDETLMSRRFVVDPHKLEVHTAAHVKSSRRAGEKKPSGGFCENDHGGPLVMGHGPTAVVIGIISACLTTNVTQKCYGPFLYTSVWKNQHFINCAIDRTAICTKYLRTRNSQIDETEFDWSQQQNGPSDVDINIRFEVGNSNVSGASKKVYGG